MTFSEFTKDDYLKIKWPIIGLLFSIVLVIGIFIALNTLNSEATRALNIARIDLNSAQTALDQIEQEEATITEYIGRYEAIDAAGIIGAEDRLQLLEHFTNIQSEFSLFPLQLNINEQQSLRLSYDTSVYKAGRPVDVFSSTVDFSLPLLHENDLGNLLTTLLNGKELLQPRSCIIKANSAQNRNYLRLAQHFTANCSVQWYTFAIEGIAQ